MRGTLRLPVIFYVLFRFFKEVRSTRGVILIQQPCRSCLAQVRQRSAGVDGDQWSETVLYQNYIQT